MKKIDFITVTISYKGSTGDWTPGSNEMKANNPTSSSGSFEKQGASMPFNSLPKPDFTKPMQEWLTALLNAAKAQQNIP